MAKVIIEIGRAIWLGFWAILGFVILPFALVGLFILLLYRDGNYKLEVA